MTWGGKREGAGRKKGSATRRSEQAMQLAATKGVDPVEILLDLTQWAYEQFTAEGGQTKENADMVRDYAKECAPYVSPKLASVHAQVETELSLFDALEKGIERARKNAAVETQNERKQSC